MHKSFREEDMRYLTFGDKNNKSVVLIHGMATTAMLCYEWILPYLKEYHVVLVEVDGHIEEDNNPLVSLEDSCSDIERYLQTELDGKVYCLSGFSMGATMVVEIAGRNNVKIEKLFLDAAFLTKMGPILTPIYKLIFWLSIRWIIKGHHISESVLDSVMGKGNRAILQMLYRGICKETIYRACQYVYTYSIPNEISSFSGDIMFIYGSNEPYPKRSAKLLGQYLPTLKINEITNMGHGQYLMSNPKEYARDLIDFLE